MTGPVYTRAVYAAAYPSAMNADRAKLTHAVKRIADGTEVALCGRVRASSIMDDPHATPEHAPPTCPMCRKRDPRQRSGGPAVLASMLQLSVPADA